MTTQQCIFDLAPEISDPNNDTLFYYSMISKQDCCGGNTDMWYMNRSQICYNGLYGSVGSCCNRVFRNNLTDYVIEVRVRDQYLYPTPFPTFTLTVSIGKVDDPPILYTPVSYKVLENVTSFEFDVNATQFWPASSTTALSFSVTSSAMANSASWLVKSSTTDRFGGIATINVTGPGDPFFNFTEYTSHDVVVYVDDGILTVSATVSIYVIYVNKYPMIINLPNSTIIKETVTGYKAIYTVSVYDYEDDPLRFQFLTATGFNQTVYDWFEIDPNYGVIYYNYPSFDFYLTNTYEMTVLVQDAPVGDVKKNATNLGNFTVIIELVNTPPYFTDPLPGAGQNGTNVTISEGVTGTADLFTLTCTDRDSDTPFYNITDMLPETNTAFQLGWTSGIFSYNELYKSTKQMFNATINPIYVITVECYDTDHMGNSSTTATLTVSISALPKVALWTSLPATLDIREDVTLAATIYTIGAIDPNELVNVTIGYIGISPASASSIFWFDYSTREFGYNSTPGFSYGNQRSYSALFWAYNGVGATQTAALAINIIKVNAGPYNNASLYNHYTELREDVTSGRLLWDLRAASNASLSIYYYIKVTSPASDAFDVTDSGCMFFFCVFFVFVQF